MLVHRDVPVEMDDGLVLRADLFLPAEEGAFPAILSYGLYGKGLAFQDGYPDQWRILCERYPDAVEGSSNRDANWEVVDPERWLPHGYSCVRIDSRGAGSSPGYLDPWSPREARDLFACIEWAAAQPWSNGRVGMAGISYYAMNQWRVAALRPPHLAAICVWEGAADFYRDACYHGGIRCVNRRNWFERQVKPVQHGVGTLSEAELEANRTDVYRDIANHPLDDGYHRSLSPDLSRVTVPLLSAGAWGGQAMHLRGNTEGFVRAASPDKWLELHGGEHWTSFYTARGVRAPAPLLRPLPQGRPAGVARRAARAAPGSARGRDVSRPRRARVAARADTLDAGRARAGADLRRPGRGCRVPAGSRRGGDGAHRPGVGRLSISSTTGDADLFLTLRVYDPAGEEVVFQGSNDPRTALGKGWLRASHRRLDPGLSTEYRPYHPHDGVEPLTPGEVYELEVEIWPLSVILPPGYRLGLRVAGRDFERAESSRLASFAVDLRGSGPYLHDDPDDRPAEIFGGRTTIHAASLLLPVIP